MKIGYLTFSKDPICYGLALTMWRNGIHAERVTEKTAHVYDVILVSVFWWQHLYDLVDFCERAKIGKRFGSTPRLIVGGFNSTSPIPLSEYAHAVVVGDGETVLADAIAERTNQSIYTGAEPSVEYAVADIRDSVYCYQNQTSLPRIEIARGCPYRCAFCQLSHTKPYREVELAAIKKSLDMVTGKRVSLVAPEATSHTQYAEIQDELRRRSIHNVCPDVRFNHVDKYQGTTWMQIGVEGLSERLRYGIGKRLSRVGMVDICRTVIKRDTMAGLVPRVMFGMILDLPGETTADWQEASDTLDEIALLPGADALCIFWVFSLFLPQPHTKLQDGSVNFREYQPMIRKLLYDRRFKTAVRGRLFAQYSRALGLIATRAGAEFGEIARNRHHIERSKPRWRMKMLDTLVGGLDKYTGANPAHHWDIVKWPKLVETSTHIQPE